MDRRYDVDRRRWSKMNIFEQMGNIYSEVGRSLDAKQRHDDDGFKQAIFRAIDLFDATVAYLIEQHSPRAREVLRAKEVFLEICWGDIGPEATKSFDRYFMQFAVAARLAR